MMRASVKKHPGSSASSENTDPGPWRRSVHVRGCPGGEEKGGEDCTGDCMVVNGCRRERFSLTKGFLDGTTVVDEVLKGDLGLPVDRHINLRVRVRAWGVVSRA